MQHNLYKSYSFSFQLKLCQDIRYFKLTTPSNLFNKMVETFILNLIKNNITSIVNNPKRGRPKTNHSIKSIDKYMSFQISLKNTTIKKIKEHKTNGNIPNIDKSLEAHLKLTLPVRDIR